MTKPQLQTISYYDYNDCIKYIEEKINIDRNGSHKFWRIILHLQDISNGCYFTLDEFLLDDILEYELKKYSSHDCVMSREEMKEESLNFKIAEKLLEEFGDEDNSIYLHVWW